MLIEGAVSSSHKQAIQWFADQLVSKQMQRQISVRIKKTTKNYEYGEIIVDDYNDRDEPRDFVIVVNKNISEEEQLRTYSHELVHMKQYLYKELNEEMNRWKGEYIDSDKTPYYEQPWEFEAHVLGDHLYEVYKNGNV